MAGGEGGSVSHAEIRGFVSLCYGGAAESG